MKNGLCERLREFRATQDITRHALAEMLGVSEVTVLRIENGSAKPNSAVASRLQSLGVSVESHETNADEIPRIRLRTSFDEPTEMPDGLPKTIRIGQTDQRLDPAPYVLNGPANQVPFFSKLFELQAASKLNKRLLPGVLAKRLSGVASAGGVPTLQGQLESPKTTAAHWNPNYGTHGWHRYIGRFPPHLVRALLNHFQATKEHTVCDPFAGSGTTLVECRLLGIPAVGIEICPLSTLMSECKSKFPADASEVRRLAADLRKWYADKWAAFVGGRSIAEIPHAEVIERPGNPLAKFSNYEKWLTSQALLGVTLVLEYAAKCQGDLRNLLLLALSAKMRSIGNVDVDVARAEYSEHPRENVDVLRLVTAALSKMAESIDDSVQTHAEIIGDPTSIRILHQNVLEAELPAGSVDFVITSPPYGVEASSYLRSHLLSYRCLYPFFKEDPYEFGNRVIGSEYVRDAEVAQPSDTLKDVSATYRQFFATCLAGQPSSKVEKRAYMMMQFFHDMDALAIRLATWVRKKGRVAFVIGNKKIGDHLIPTDKIIAELFAAHGLQLDESICHKLKCNNTNSQVPWQERVIQEEFVLLFTRR